MTTFPVLDLRLAPLAEAAREYARPEAPPGIQKALIELVRQTFTHARAVLDRHLAVLRQARMELENPPESAEVRSKYWYSLADHVAGSLELADEVAALRGTIEDVVSDLEDTASLVALLDECDQLRGRLVEACRQFESDHPELAGLGLTDQEKATATRYDAQERAATCSPLCVAVAGSAGAVAFTLGGIGPAILVGVVLFILTAALAERVLRGTVG